MEVSTTIMHKRPNERTRGMSACGMKLQRCDRIKLQISMLRSKVYEALEKMIEPSIKVIKNLLTDRSSKTLAYRVNVVTD